MKALAKLVFGTLGCVLLISGIAVLSPQAVHAVVATIIRDQDNPARHPFTTSCNGAFTGTLATCSTFPIPAGQEVVIETISFGASGDPGNSALEVSVTTTAASVGGFHIMPTIFDDNLGQPIFSSFAAVQSVRLYADPGSSIECAGLTKNKNLANIAFGCQISGYFVTLP